MKTIRLLLFIFFCAGVHAGQSQEPLQWNAAAKITGDHTYSISVSVSLPDGWHVYAQEDTALGLEPLHLEWNNENIVKDNGPEENKKEVDFTDPLFDNKKVRILASNTIYFSLPVKINGDIPASLKITLKGFASNNKEFLPINETKQIQLEGGFVSVGDPIRLAAVHLKQPVSTCGDSTEIRANLLTIFIRGFAGGLLALLMPCLFPMIPVTVSFFTNKASSKREGVRQGLLYGLSILFIYLLASLPFHILGTLDPQIFNSIATNAWVNVGFFIVFVLFAFSLFGVFEFRLPASFSNKAGARSGIFFMALTLAIVSFSCTGPILGTLLVGSLSAKGNPWELTIGMGGFGLALALPFALFALFPQWLKSIPRSGGWLETVKKSLAFVELAFAIKFLSNADLVEHWGILKREVFIGSWILIATLLALYLFGAFHKNKTGGLYVTAGHMRQRRSYGRIGFGVLSLLFACYLVPGLTPTQLANLKLLSGFPPPLSYSIYGKENVKGKGLEPDVVNDYKKALQLSREQQKPLLIDFTGWACVNCRKMEEQVWTRPEIKKLIEDNYILVSLYVDDRKKLPAAQQFTYKDRGGNEKDIRTLGDKWATFQAANFGGVSQPMYAILSPDEKLMNLPVGYSQPEKYKEWLQCGLDAYYHQQQKSSK